MKALEKDRDRRYETANALAADVERYLNDEPVQACPPSAAYRSPCRGIALIERVAADFPDDADAGHDLGRSYANLAQLLLSSHKEKEAESAFRHGRTVLEKLVSEFPGRPEISETLAGEYWKWAGGLLLARRHAEAQPARARRGHSREVGGGLSGGTEVSRIRGDDSRKSRPHIVEFRESNGGG